jgi:hypothetical protein
VPDAPAFTSSACLQPKSTTCGACRLGHSGGVSRFARGEGRSTRPLAVRVTATPSDRAPRDSVLRYRIRRAPYRRALPDGRDTRLRTIEAIFDRTIDQVIPEQTLRHLPFSAESVNDWTFAGDFGQSVAALCLLFSNLFARRGLANMPSRLRGHRLEIVTALVGSSRATLNRSAVGGEEIEPLLD